MTKRDFCKYANIIGTEILEIILKSGDIQKTKLAIKEKLNDLVNGKINPELLAIYKKLAKKKYSGRVGHAELAKRIEIRNPGHGPKTGDSVKFLYIDIGDIDNKKKMDEKIEDFDFVIQNNIPIDYLWYIDNQLKKTIQTIMSPVLNDHEINLLINDIIIQQKSKQQKINLTSIKNWDYENLSDYD